MPLYVRDPEVDALADRLMTLKKVSKTEAVRQALRHEIEREQAKPDLVAQIAEYSSRFRARIDPIKVQPVDKAYIDSLYEDD